MKRAPSTFESDSRGPATVPLARRLRGQNTTRKNGDCAIAFLTLTEKRPTSSQRGKTYANFMTTGKSDRHRHMFWRKTVHCCCFADGAFTSHDAHLPVSAFECWRVPGVPVRTLNVSLRSLVRRVIAMRGSGPFVRRKLMPVSVDRPQAFHQ